VEIFTKLGGIVLSRWFHVLAGVTWIGLLYYFNFVQTPALAGFEAGSRTEVQAKLLPRALWWFRWGAALTLLTGIMILGFQEQFKASYFKTPSGASIITGAGIAIVMFLNVWLVIWPNQKIVIANAQNVLAGGEPDPAVPAAARRGALASRTNTLFSIPMLFFMVATNHFFAHGTHWKQYHVRDGMNVFGPGRSHLLAYGIIGIVLVALIEANALGYLGGTGPGPTRKFLDDHRQTLVAGFILWAILYALFEIFFRA
jgi:uncharacterized membrane protein